MTTKVLTSICIFFPLKTCNKFTLPIYLFSDYCTVCFLVAIGAETATVSVSDDDELSDKKSGCSEKCTVADVPSGNGQKGKKISTQKVLRKTKGTRYGFEISNFTL